jgi:hypothetical protein
MLWFLFKYSEQEHQKELKRSNRTVVCSMTKEGLPLPHTRGALLLKKEGHFQVLFLDSVPHSTSLRTAVRENLKKS